MIRLFLLLFATLFVHADETPSYFSPKLYRSFWPDFCLEHLQQFPLECSEQHTDINGNFPVLKPGASEAYIDEEILARLVSYSHPAARRLVKSATSFIQKCMK